MVATSCDLMRPGAPPQPSRYVYTGPGVFVDHRPPRPPETPVIPCFYKHIIYYNAPPLKFYVCTDVSHTHTHSAVGRVFLVQMRWRWGWRGKWGWYGSEGEMKKYLTGTWGGECKRRGREQTPIPTHLARSGQTLKGQEKRKAEADGHGTRPAEGVERTEAPQPT